MNLVIYPVYNEAKYLETFYQSLRKIYFGDVLFIDDGSTDRGKDFLITIRDFHTSLFRPPQKIRLQCLSY
ncbi:MAG: glycosyltransferase [Candidatus Omnitrophica bacterium]|nr:glycosyltransferase [Candidatus Omnitrophota bacterium]